MNKTLTTLYTIILIFNSSFSQDFTTITNDPAVQDNSQSYGSSFVDFDNDGDIDLYNYSIVLYNLNTLVLN